jgi:hypothetical protein
VAALTERRLMALNRKGFSPTSALGERIKKSWRIEEELFSINYLEFRNGIRAMSAKRPCSGDPPS